MENEEETQSKQTLLQTEIIEKNFDKTAFINFCLSKKENGDDLNNWTLAELTDIVKEFVNSQGGNVVQSSEQKPQEEEEIKKENIEKIEKFNADETKITNLRL